MVAYHKRCLKFSNKNLNLSKIILVKSNRTTSGLDENWKWDSWDNIAIYGKQVGAEVLKRMKEIYCVLASRHCYKIQAFLQFMDLAHRKMFVYIWIYVDLSHSGKSK